MQNTIHQIETSENSDSLPEIERESSVPSLIYRLCTALADEKLSYCHWKSNNAIDKSATGDNDLDLLIDREDIQRFSEILYRLKFKRAEAPPKKRMPGVHDFFGYDSGKDKFVHVHAHYQLILGHDMTKNYHLPIERPYLESAIQDDLFKLPEPEFEMIIFVIRMILKHSTWDAILRREGKLKVAERQELEYLLTRSNKDRINSILKQHFPNIRQQLFDNCIQTLNPGSSFWMRIKTGHHLQSSLRANTRRGLLADTFLKFLRRAVLVFQRRVFKSSPKYHLESGGAMIGIVGGDGAGKSTAIDGLRKWLSKDIEVHYTHLGKPGRSMTTKFVRGLFKIARRITSTPYVPEGNVLYKAETNLPGWILYYLAVNAVCAARDRYSAYSKARRLANNGGLVICDRFPLSQINLTDGPIIEQLMNDMPNNSLIQLLVKLEKKYYLPIVWPELLFVLKLDPQIAVQRKTDEDPEYVQARSQVIWLFDWQQTPATVIDAANGEGDVLSELKSLIWSEL